MRRFVWSGTANIFQDQTWWCGRFIIYYLLFIIYLEAGENPEKSVEISKRFQRFQMQCQIVKFRCFYRFHIFYCHHLNILLPKRSRCKSTGFLWGNCISVNNAAHWSHGGENVPQGDNRCFSCVVPTNPRQFGFFDLFRENQLFTQKVDNCGSVPWCYHDFIYLFFIF